MGKFDYTGYVVKYDRKYNSGNTFRKGCFKINPDRIVPIVHDQNHNMCFGSAKLEDHVDGLVAKCTFRKDDTGRIILELLDSGECDLSFLACPVKRNDGVVTFGVIQAVLVLDKRYKPRVVCAEENT